MRSHHVAVDDDAVRVHLERGTCLLAGAGNGCACGLTDANGDLRVDLARRMWGEHRGAILAEWKSDAPPWGATVFADADE